jgi:hypothetical protein
MESRVNTQVQTALASVTQVVQDLSASLIQCSSSLKQIHDDHNRFVNHVGAAQIEQGTRLDALASALSHIQDTLADRAANDKTQVLQLTHSVRSLQSSLESSTDELRGLIGARLPDALPPAASPILALSFAESLNAARFSEAMQGAVLQNVASALSGQLGDLASIGVQSIALVNGRAQMVFTLSSEGQQLVRQGLATWARHRETGNILPFIQEVGTGESLEYAKHAKLGQAVGKLASAGALVVAAAHIISGADVVKRLERIEKDTKFLVAAHRFDQLATLESVYMHARELLSGPIDQAKAEEIGRLRRELMRLRSAWRQELTFKLQNVNDPANAAVYKRWFGKKALHKGVVAAVSDGEQEIGLLEYTLRLDLALATVSGTSEQFLTKTLPATLGDWKTVQTLLEEKAGYISGKYPDLDLRPVIASLTEVIAAYETLAEQSLLEEYSMLEVS